MSNSIKLTYFGKALSPLLTHSMDGTKLECLVRKKFIPATPEEYIRQSMLSFLLIHAMYCRKEFLRYRLNVEQDRLDISLNNNIESPRFQIPITSLVIELKAGNTALEGEMVKLQKTLGQHHCRFGLLVNKYQALGVTLEGETHHLQSFEQIEQFILVAICAAEDWRRWIEKQCMEARSNHDFTSFLNLAKALGLKLWFQVSLWEDGDKPRHGLRSETFVKIVERDGQMIGKLQGKTQYLSFNRDIKITPNNYFRLDRITPFNPNKKR